MNSDGNIGAWPGNMCGSRRHVFLSIILSALVSAAAPAAAQDTQGPEVTRWTGAGLDVEFAPLPMEPAAAFFLNRGFPHAVAVDFVREGCVFRSSIGHGGSAAAPVHVDLEEWQVRIDGAWQGYRTKEAWQTTFAEKDIPKPARIAFRWATFPTVQVFEANDYNWGIHAFGLPAGTRFDLRLRWRQAGKAEEYVMEGLSCPVDDLDGGAN